MAEVTERKTSDPILVKRTDVETKAKENKEARELPEPPGAKVGFNELLQWVDLLTPDMIGDGGRVMLYVYRTDPLINRQLLDPHAPNYIDCIGGSIENIRALNEKYFIDRHGGGRYKIVVSDADKPEGKTKYGRSWFEAFLHIATAEHPPKLDYREVMWDHRQNRGFQTWARGQKIIDENNNVIPPGQAAPANNSNDAMVQAFKIATDFVSKMSQSEQDKLKRQIGGDDSLGKSIGEILLEKMKQDDPSKMVTTLVALLNANKSSGDGGLAAIVPLITGFMSQMAESNRAAMDASNKQFMLMLELVKSKDTNSGNGGDEIDKLHKILEIARELKGGGSSPKSQVAEIIDAAAPIVQPALQIISNITAMRAAAMGSNPPQVQTPTTQSTHIQQQQHQPQPTQQPQLPGASQVTQDEAVAIITQFRPIILNKLAGKGWELGAWITEGFGDMVAASVAKQGEDKLLAAMKAIPDFWQAVTSAYSEDYVKTWLKSFVNYKKEMEEYDGEDD